MKGPRSVLGIALVALAAIAVTASSQASTINDFDLAGTPWVGASSVAGREPVVMPAGPTGNYIQLMPNLGSQLNTLAFNQTDGGMVVSSISFDFRMTSETAGANQRADGFSVSIIDPVRYGTSGALATGLTNWERPRFPGSLAVGFDVYESTGANNVFSLNSRSAELATRTINDSTLQLTRGVFHRAQITVSSDGVSGTSTVSMSITPDVYGVPGSPVAVFTNQQIAALPPVGGRLAFGGRTGGLSTAVDLDNIQANYVAAGAGAGVPVGITSGPVLLGPVLANGKRNAYQLVTSADGLTWDEARYDASRHTYGGMQGHLVSVANAVENAFAGAFGSGDRWMGFTDSNATSTIDGRTMPGLQGQQFRWITGEPVTYTSWAGGEPNLDTTEDAANFRGDGLWNNLPAGASLGQADNRLGSYVIEYEVGSTSSVGLPRVLPKLGPVLPDGTRSAYEYVATASSWTAAKADAASRQFLGVQGHLVTIANQAEQNFVQGLGNGWIGFTDDPAQASGASEGNFRWVVATEGVTYTNWNGGEPNNAGGTEHYAELTPGWNDLPNSSTRNYTVEYGLGAAQRSVRTRFAQLATSGGADNDLNSAGEALTVQLGYGVGSQYSVAFSHTSDPSNDPYEADFAGGGGNFGFNNPYYPGAPGDPGEDFTQRTTARMFIPEGDWTIAFAGDDGGLVHLDNVQFLAQINTDGDNKANDGTILFNSANAHSATLGHFTVPAGGITTNLDALFFERAGGDYNEISIAPGHWPGFSNQGFGILADQQFGWRVTPQDPNPGFNVRMIQLDPSNPSGFDNSIDSAPEAVALSLGVSGTGDFSIGGQLYRVTTFRNATAPYVDFGGSAGSFNEPTLNYPDGRSSPGDDFLVGAQAFMRLPAGTYTIAAAGDDGKALQLMNALGGTFSFTQEIGSSADPTLNNTLMVSSTATTMGVFTVGEGTVLELNALFYERAGGDSFEISLARGAFTSFNATDFFVLRNGVFPGLLLAPDLLAVVPEPSTFALLGLGLVGLGVVGWRRRRGG